MTDSNTDNALHYVKDSGPFSFIIINNTEMRTSNQSTLVSDCKRIQLFLDGVVYNHNKKKLISGFAINGADYVKKLEGSFAIYLFDGSQFYVLTDKVNSRKAFYALVDGAWFVSTNIDDLPKDRCKLSIDGIASYLSNGVMLNDLTLFHGIRSVKRASIHCFKNGHFTVNSYWEYDFSYSKSELCNEEEYQHELQQLLINSIKLRYSATNHNIALSLSAGYDSRGILGIIHKYLQATNISCFSYALDDSPKFHSDAARSIELAEKCGYDHNIFKSYKGDLVSYLVGNAVVGKCIANFCDELDAWHSLSKRKFSDIFVGDECFGGFVELQTKEEIFDSVSISGSNSVAFLKNFISGKIYADIVNSINKTNDCIFESTRGIAEPCDKKDFLWLDQAINHVYMPWRECISSKAGYVHNPYLDGDILNFIMKLPPRLRKNKYLFRRTIKVMLPDLFSVPQAKSSGYVTDWQNEIRQNKKQLIEFVNKNESRLDDIISREEVVATIHSICSSRGYWMQTRSFTKRALNFIRKKNKRLDRLIGRIVGSRVPSGGQRVNPTKLLIRLLVMRIYLTN